MENQFMLTPFFLDRYSAQLEALQRSGWVLNKPDLPEGDLQPRMSAYHQPIAEFAAETLRNGSRPVSIAGDCCTAIGFAAGMQRAGLDPVLLWLDAHGDFNTWETTPSGFLGGMPLAMLVGLGDMSMPQAVGLASFKPEDVILYDARDLDPGEKRLLTEAKVNVVSDLESLKNHPLLARPLYVHFDTDLLNPEDAPAMGYLAAGGPKAKELKTFFQFLSQEKEVVGVSISSWRPDMDVDGRTQAVCMDLLFSLIQI